ncbi:MAG: hypothetical protein Q8P41_29565 [Pseudomonadota bacterium]|nr:hypothetical protein [Pseudomonadota bacterium]
MNRLSDIISRIFSTDQTQGLSGGAEVVIDRDPASSFYASRLRKHRSDEDLVELPTWLWATASYNGRKGGLRSHIHAERGQGVASFTDVLVVLNQVDARRAAQVEGEPWTERAARAINEKFALYCQKERFELLYGTRPLRFWFVADGGQDMLGHSFGLGPGEFITGLLPNLYVGPAPRSRPVLAVHLHLPGAWEGYREVGRLYSDQILYTLGRHWLDNFHHPALREPGLYRLQQFPDGSLVHVISPELQDRYFVRSDALDGGASVLTLAERNGTPVAYLVLAVVETPAMADPGMTVGVPLASLRSAGLGPTPVEVGAEDDADATVRAAGAAADAAAYAPGPTVSSVTRRDQLQRTIIPDAIEGRMLTLHERGALLQKVHFANFMDGYDVYIGSGGRIATQMPDPRATLQVRGGKVSLHVSVEGVRMDGRPQPAGATIALSGSVEIEVDGHTLQYRDLSGVRADGWPYLGELRRPGAGTYLDFGGVFRVGRDRRCQVRLPDEPHNENIAWLPSVGGGTTIRSRTGDIPKSRFYTDSIMVASEHAELDLASDPMLRSLARHCYTFVRRDGNILSLSPREAGDGKHELALRPNDEVLVGNCLFQVSYPPVAGAPMATPVMPEVPRPPSAEELAALIDLPPAKRAGRPLDDDAATVFGNGTDRPSPDLPPNFRPPPLPPEPPAAAARPVAAAPGNGGPPPLLPSRPPIAIASSATYDPAVAAGLGELGPAPRPPRLKGPSTSPRPASFDNAAPPPIVVYPVPEPPPADPLAESPKKGFRSAASLPDTSEAPPPPPGPAAFGMAGSARQPLAQAPGSIETNASAGLFARGPEPRGPLSASPSVPPPAFDPKRPPPPMLLDDDEYSVPLIAAPPADARARAPEAPQPDLPLFEEVEGADPAEPVLAVEEARWKVELARPARLLQVGWMVSGEVVVGNHTGAQVVVPEVRAFKEQAFLTLDYFRLSTRGRKGHVTLLQEGEASLAVKGTSVPTTDDLNGAELTIVRRDANLEPDFDVVLRLLQDDTLPDPRARLVAVDTTDRLVAALFTLGFPLRADRRLAIGRIVATFRYDGAQLHVTDYLSTYRTGNAFLPFFHRSGDRPWQTLPEDGERVLLRPGDGLIVGNAVYRFQAG